MPDNKKKARADELSFPELDLVQDSVPEREPAPDEIGMAGLELPPQPGYQEYLAQGPQEDPGDDDDDADEDDESGDHEQAPAQESPVAVGATTPRMSRRGFLGAAASIVGGVAAAAVAPQLAAAESVVAGVPPVGSPAVGAPAAGIPGLSPEMNLMMQHFKVLMIERDTESLLLVDKRLDAIRAEIRAELMQAAFPSTNGQYNHAIPQAAQAPVQAAEMAAPPGQYPPSMTMPGLAQAGVPQELLQRAPAPKRMVAFIPREDSFNPRQTTFKTWCNGRESRGKRGQVMLLPAGQGVDLARNGHGNCIDIAAMQGVVGMVEPMTVPQAPDYSRPDDWDGQPLFNRSSFAVGGVR